MAIFGPSTITLVSGEIIVKNEVAVVTPLTGKIIPGETDHRSYQVILKSGLSFEVFERNQPYSEMVAELGFS